MHDGLKTQGMCIYMPCMHTTQCGSAGALRAVVCVFSDDTRGSTD
jgi:hypothetical protein